MTSYRRLSAANTRQSTAIDVNRDLRTHTHTHTHTQTQTGSIHIHTMRYVDLPYVDEDAACD